MLPISSSSSTPRAYSGAHFGMTLGGKYTEVGLFRSIEGGGVKVDVTSYQTGGSPMTLKQVGKPKFEDFKVSCGMAMGVPFYRWLQEFFAGSGTRRDGELLAADFHYNVRARRQFTGALLTEVALPKLDAADKGPANLTATISPEDMAFLKPEANQKLFLPERTIEQKLWASCNFEMALSNYPDISGNVSKIDGFSVKQKVSEYHTGGTRHPRKFPGRLELPAINFYVPEAFAYQLMYDVRERSFKGPAVDAAPLDGTITTFSNDKTPMFSVEFGGGEITGISIDKSDATSEEIKQVKFEMQIQSIKFAHIDIDTADEKFKATFGP